ncbi:storkhead-box protein 1 isoform X2 [Hyperolius riggenbachi]|uniref:storkhead-box protein 1 isoform X2 n=1 Tax=Hyperolius riggenbachi TaxID=752182 RepID=UPI0035A35763
MGGCKTKVSCNLTTSPRCGSVRNGILGDVCPVQMNPVSQSQFIPLAEVLCCAISDMNAAQTLVTQDSLMEQLIKHYPGIATPSQEILYSTLGTLIKERKVFHTGEGYFIVTPQTYYITRKPFSHKCGTAEAISATPPTVTYLVSMESCADLTKANVPPVSHCRSCSCFSESSTQNILGQQSINESNAKEQRTVKDSKPSVLNQATSTSQDHHACAKTKPQLALKDKEKCNKKFGISLFWRNVSKKEKSKKELVSFSAQFPPEEWPVRDEDSLDNIPRDIEHEIIKRINPVLTVDNLMKHTLLMQKIEEQKKYFSKGTSTDIIRNKNGHNTKSGRKKNGRLSKYHKKVQASKEKSKKDTCAQRSSIQVESGAVKKSGHQTSGVEDMLTPDVFTPSSADVEKHEAHYKRQIQNPFEGISYRDNGNISGHRSVKDTKRANSGKDRKNVLRSKSLDCPGSNAEGDTKHLKSERPVVDYDSEELFQDQMVPVSDKDDLREYPPNYPQSSTLRIDDKFKQNREHSSALGLSGEEGTSLYGDNQTNMLLKSEVTWEHEREKTFSSGLYCSKINTVNCLLQHSQSNVCKTLNASKSFCQSYIGSLEEAETEQMNCYATSGVKTKDLQKYQSFTNSQVEGNPEDDPDCYTNVVDNEDASCSYSFEADTDDHLGMCENLDICMQNMDTLNWNEVHEDSCSASESSPSHWESKRSPLHQFKPSIGHHREECAHSVFSSDCAQSCTKPSLLLKGNVSQPLSQYLLSHPEDDDAVPGIQPSELVDGSIFDYCNSSDCNSMADTVQTSIKGSNEKHVEDPRQQSGEMRTCYEHALKLFSAKSTPLETNQNENHSTTGDSGIESPRTRISLASNNSMILETLKKRTFLQNLDISNKNDGLLTSNSLMQLTPAINV